MNPELRDVAGAKVVTRGFELAQKVRVDAVDAELNVIVGREALVTGLAGFAHIVQGDAMNS